MNIQSFYEYVILRDILAFILPGGISLAGVYMIAQAIGNSRWEKTMPLFSNIPSFITIILLILISFLIGHIWDMVYRVRVQTKKGFQREETLRKLLVGNQSAGSKPVDNHIATEIRQSVGQFLKINWKKMPIEQWIESGKAHEASVLLAYWIEEEDPKLFGTEIGRPIVQAQFLIVCGLAFYFIGGFCAPAVGIIYWLGINPLQEFDPLTFGILIVSSLIFGRWLFVQGLHKREIFIEHVLRVFYVVWRKRVLEHEANMEIVQYSGSPNKGNRSRKVKP